MAAPRLGVTLALVNVATMAVASVSALVLLSNEQNAERLDAFRRDVIRRACGPVVAETGPVRERIQTLPDGTRAWVWEADRPDGGSARVVNRIDLAWSPSVLSADCGG